VIQGLPGTALEEAIVYIAVIEAVGKVRLIYSAGMVLH